MFTSKRILVVALSAALAACGGGKASQGEVDALSAQVAAQQKTIDGLNASSTQQLKEMQDKLAAQQATLDDLLAKMAANAETQQSQWQEILALRATIDEQQKYIRQLQAGAEKVDMAGPVLKNFTVSKSDVVMPDTLVLSVEAQDSGAGMLKVEFYEAGSNVPVAIAAKSAYSYPYPLDVPGSSTYSTYSVILPLGVQDNGTHSYYVRAYDMAVTAAGTLASNVTSNADAAVPVKVAIPDNGVEFAGSLKSEFGVEPVAIASLKPDPHHAGVFMAVTNEWSVSNLLKVDYGNKTASKLASGSDSVIDIAFHPKQADTLFRSLGYEIQSSTNGGSTWSTVARRDGYYSGVGYTSYAARFLAFTPSGNRLFAFNYGNGDYGYYAYGDALSYSVNGGSTWKAATTAAYYGEPIGSVMVGGGDERIVYASTTSRVLRSSDGGNSFSFVGNLPSTLSLSSSQLMLSADPFDANVVLALVQTYTFDQGQRSKLYRSTDGGATWSAVQMPTTPLGQLLFDGQAGGTAVMSVVHNAYVKGLVYMPAFVGQNSAAVLRSKDGGATWDLLPYFDPASKGYDSRNSASWLVTTKPDADGAVQLFLPSSKGFNRYLDRTALK
ncbi:sialidase family protein [Azohydromonas australica]|uniref:sialidase family protein n=1 Tax=Azohydromonas australica TaxID=364039 RepID=UPI000418D351|nr:sialidase family protein [Azohydromonas australica]